MSVGVIGFGRFGALLTCHFAKDFPIRVYDAKLRPSAVRALGAVPATLAQACAEDVVVLCVPMARFENLLRRIRGLLRKDALIIDACAAKDYPARVMRRLLPRSVEILATHPIFGPDSAAPSLRGRKIVVCKIRVRPQRYRKVRRVLEAKGLDVVEMSPREHDRRMAASLVLPHFIGRTLLDCGAETTGVDTEGYKSLLRLLRTVQNDSWQLFADMNRYNAFAAPMRRRFLASMRRIDRKVGG